MAEKQLFTADGHSLMLGSKKQSLIIRWQGEVGRAAFEQLHQRTERWNMHYGVSQMLCNSQTAYFNLSTDEQLEMMGTIARLHNAGLRKIAMVHPKNAAFGNEAYLLQESASSIFSVQGFTSEAGALSWLRRS